ncbi:MAG: glutamine--tRNA ligase/YqeY domain fusion protein [Desulfonatronovibrio sp.]
MELNTQSNFIREIIKEDIASGRHKQVVTRFPPEPNGYLHIGHAKSICLNFGVVRDFGGRCHVRFDDTNPKKEDPAYVSSILYDVRWLGFDWGEHLYNASDYFEQFYQYALELIRIGKAYVCSLNAEEIRQYRGTLTEPGKDSPYRQRSVEENLDLFQRMRQGEFDEGTHVLRARIDMASPNMNMRDPVLFRIVNADHHQTGDAWRIYPTYDYAHCLSDSIEGITHSLCSLEFQDHRPLYNWILEQLPVKCHPRQIEFARLNLNYTVMSKRKLSRLVSEGLVHSWDDPRMPTLSGLRRRGYTPESIRRFCDIIGVAKSDNIVDMSMLEYCVREDLNKKAPRVMAVINPVKLIITNYPEDGEEELEAVNNPEDENMGTRMVPFSRELYIEREDFMEDPPKKFFRLSPGREVRLRYAYYVTCQDIVKDPVSGEVKEIHCTYDPATRGGDSPDGRKVKATLHWVSVRHAGKIEVRMYDRLFSVPNPTEGEKKGIDFLEYVNPDSLKVLKSCYIEPGLENAAPGDFFQFERLGYFCVDPDTEPDRTVFNRTVTLRDAWARIQKKTRKG